MPIVTVLTTTHNRAHTLPRLYDSLQAQTFRGFEWVIVDNGSTDGTDALVHSWTSAGEIEISYLPQPDCGKHGAVNRGAIEARGEYITIVDSDNWLLPDSLERLVRHWNEIPASARSEFSGVVGLCSFEDGTVVGDVYPENPLDCDSVELTYIHGVTGDKHGLLRTDVLREFQFPFPECKLVTEAIVWNRMALEYRERHVNEVVLVMEYLPDGLSARALELLIASSPATRQFHLEETRLPHRIPIARRLRSYANYVRFSIHAGVALRDQARDAPSKVAWLGLVPLGLALYVRDRWRFHGRRSRQ